MVEPIVNHWPYKSNIASASLSLDDGTITLEYDGYVAVIRLTEEEVLKSTPSP